MLPPVPHVIPCRFCRPRRSRLLVSFFTSYDHAFLRTSGAVVGLVARLWPSSRRIEASN
jgi:hypothetical protein